MKYRSIFRSAISDEDGEVDAGYLALFWTMVVVLSAIPFMCFVAAIAMYMSPDHLFNAQDLGIGIGAVAGGFATVSGAIGFFRMGDKPRDPAVGTTTTREKITTVDVPAAEITSGAMESAGRGVEPLSPSIKPHDVGKSVALVSRKRKR